MQSWAFSHKQTNCLSKSHQFLMGFFLQQSLYVDSKAVNESFLKDFLRLTVTLTDCTKPS
jgi:hypothetical protein